MHTSQTLNNYLALGWAKKTGNVYVASVEGIKGEAFISEGANWLKILLPANVSFVSKVTPSIESCLQDVTEKMKKYFLQKKATLNVLEESAIIECCKHLSRKQRKAPDPSCLAEAFTLLCPSHS